ncbi:hypothetical protein P691DRAFT_515225 [Macrolepiota fuliginosa MF-IS2]|uniref:Uncharacterized protein n=1 Tax=Macrolepiota fuliginosa MF-IS2 TaxID=1400762 RepID=A0A9P5XGG7_9AGAR|nr:hypothetical protein P691DRAFT_515225 [Macrolepiota fuliginosa MF-IS2]
MVNWSDPNEITKDEAVFEKLVFALFGTYIWEIVLHFDFEWSFITRRRSFRWPLVIFYFFCRYCMLFSFIGLIISLTVTTPVNCRALFTFNSWTGNMTILCASTSLMLRTIALWNRKKPVIAVLGVLCLAHWGLLYRTMFIVVAEWDPVLGVCAVTQTSPSLLNTTFFFTMGFDLTILIFSATALLGRHTARTDLWKLLFRDGLVYFLISFTVNCIPAVLNVLNLNTPMNVIATVPAAMVTSIAACRAVIRLMEFSSSEPYVHDMSHISGSGTKSAKQSIIPRLRSKREKTMSTRPEVHVTTEHITMAEFPSPSYSSPCSKSGFSITSCEDSTSAKEAKGISEKDIV